MRNLEDAQVKMGTSDPVECLLNPLVRNTVKVSWVPVGFVWESCEFRHNPTADPVSSCRIYRSNRITWVELHKLTSYLRFYQNGLIFYEMSRKKVVGFQRYCRFNIQYLAVRSGRRRSKASGMIWFIFEITVKDATIRWKSVKVKGVTSTNVSYYGLFKKNTFFSFYNIIYTVLRACGCQRIVNIYFFRIYCCIFIYNVYTYVQLS